MAGALVQQQTPASVNAGTSLGINLTGVAAGNLLVLSVGTWNHTGAVGTVSGGGATWTNRLNVSQGASTNGSEQWEGLNTTGGSITVTWTRAGASSPDISVCLQEWSGMPTTGAFDVAASASGTGTAPDSGLTAATAQADALAVSLCDNDDANTTMVSRAGDGYTDLNGVTNGSTSAAVRPAYQVLSATGQQQGRFTLGVSTGWGAGVAVYKAAAGAAQSTPELYGRPFGQHGHRQMHQVLAQ